MSYNCLFSVLTDTALVDETLDHAIAMAGAHNAHLDVLCLGVDRSQTGYYYAGASAVVLQETITRAQEEAEEIDAKVRQRLGREDMLWASEKGVCQLADLGRHVASRARFSDLAILPQPYGEGRGAELEPAAESVLFDGRTPALIVLNRVPPRANLTDEMVAAVKKYGASVARGRVGNRVVFASALSDGRAVGEVQPRGKAAAEIKALAKEILRKAG